MSWKAWGETDQGKVRQNNEDRILCDTDRGIFIVADGMGGEAAGEIAAQQAVDSILQRLSEKSGTAARRLREAITSANNEVFRLADRNPQWRGMACVLTAAFIEDGSLHIGHVGDSRLYKIQKGAISKITHDHSPVGQKEDSGEYSELEAMRHPMRNEVFRDVGSQPRNPDDENFIEYLQVPFESDATYLLCSDGLSDLLTSQEIFRAVTENAGIPKNSVQQLIRKANAAGGKDNISAVVVEGEAFAAASGKAFPERGRVFPTLSGFRGRWAFLLYGLAAGMLTYHFWLSPATKGIPGPEPPSAAITEPATLQVDPGGAQYQTISSALEAAHAGDRIEIGDGHYEELIRLKEGVEVSARSPGKAILHISRALPNADAAITADELGKAAVNGLVIMAEPAAGLPYGIRISNSNITVQNVEISGAVRAGILIDGASGSSITASKIYANAGPGIVTAGKANPSIVGNVLYANGISKTNPSPGLRVTDISYPEVKRNVFNGNGAGGIRIPRQELRNGMMDNLFVNSGKAGKAVTVERIRP